MTPDPTSLASTLDAVNDALFNDVAISGSDRRETARWIASRQGMPGSYHGYFFAPTEQDFSGPAPLFTGETRSSRGGLAHVLGEESCRALTLLGPLGPEPMAALVRARDGMTDWLARDRPLEVTGGLYCCGTCSVALWRNMVAGGLPDARPDDRLAAGMNSLREHRKGDGSWRRFPPWYTLLALTETDLPAARDELRYAAPRIERALKRSADGDRFVARRRAVGERALELV